MPAFGIFILRDKGFFIVVNNDFMTQQITFATAAWEGLRSGGEWYWGLDLGSSLINAFSFYNLGSPFFWIYLLLPKASFPYVVGFIYMLKYVVASITAYYFLSRFTQKRAAVIGALLYAFSGFQTTNLMFYHFHDVVAFFPLLLIGAEQMLEERRTCFFVFSVFLNCLINYFFFIQEVVFLVIYFLFRVCGRKKLGEIVSDGLRFMLYGALGIGMAMVLFLPGVLYVLGSNRGHVGFGLSDIIYTQEKLMNIVKGMLLPGDAMNCSSAVIRQLWDSTACYLSLFGLSYVFAYIFKKQISWLKSLLILLLCFSLIKITNSMFLLFAESYQRWWYMLVLMMALATAKVVDTPEEFPISKGIWTYIAIIAAFYLGVRYIHIGLFDFEIYDAKRFLVFFLIAAGGATLLLIVQNLKRGKYIFLITAVSICCLATTMITLNSYRQFWDESEYNDSRNRYYAGLQLHDIDEQYRFDSNDNLLLLPNNTAGTGAFTSTAESSTYDFCLLFDKWTTNHPGSRLSVPYVSQLTGGKYKISSDPRAERIIYSVEDQSGSYYICEGEACPIGFWADKYISENALKTAPVQDRAVILMNAVLVADDDLYKVEDELEPAEISDIDLSSPEMSIRQAVERSVNDFSRDSRGFACRTDWNETRYVYFSVPYDRGWKACIDGEAAEILNSGGMMVLRVPEGAHRIVFEYHKPGFRAGVIISACSFAVFFALLFFSRKRVQRSRGI